MIKTVQVSPDLRQNVHKNELNLFLIVSFSLIQCNGTKLYILGYQNYKRDRLQGLWYLIVDAVDKT